MNERFRGSATRGNQKTPLVVINGSSEFGGFGRPDLYVEQAIEDLRVTLLEIRRSSTAGKLL